MTEFSKTQELAERELEAIQGGILLPAVQKVREAAYSGDSSGNTTFLGSANGGVWKTTG